MNDTRTAAFFRTDFEIEAPDFWWALNREEVQIMSPAEFSLEMSVLEDDDALPSSIFIWRTRVTWTQVIALLPEFHATILKVKAGPSFSEAMQHGLLSAPISGCENRFTYDWIPKPFFAEMLRVHAELDRTAFRVINSLFWRIGVHCGPSKLQSDFDVMEYSVDGVDFDTLPFRWDLQASPYHPAPPKPVPAAFAQHLEKIEDAPIHHALFKEAWKCLGSEDRVAVVMATAAVESAIKYLISKLQSDTTWLLENIPSPPVVKMLRELIEKLPAKCNFNGKVLRPPKDMIQKISKLIECRNKIVHGSPSELPGEKELKSGLIAVRDMLWLADFYCGHDWALAHISLDVIDHLRKEE